MDFEVCVNFGREVFAHMPFVIPVPQRPERVLLLKRVAFAT